MASPPPAWHADQVRNILLGTTSEEGVLVLPSGREVRVPTSKAVFECQGASHVPVPLGRLLRALLAACCCSSCR